MSNETDDTDIRIEALRLADGKGLLLKETLAYAQDYYEFLTSAPRITGAPRIHELSWARRDMAAQAKRRHHDSVKREAVVQELMDTIHTAGVFADSVLLSEAITKTVKEAKLQGES